MTTTPTGIGIFDDGFLNAGISASDTTLTVAPIYKYPGGVKTRQGFDSTVAIAIIELGGVKERVRIYNRSYNSTTCVTTYSVDRGLSQTATTANYTPGTGKTWNKNARIYVPVDNGNLANAAYLDTANPFSGKQTFSGGTRHIPFANTGARDAAFPSPVEGDHCVVTGVGEQNFLFGGWVTTNATSNVPMTTTAAGTGELGTVADAKAATGNGNSGAPVVVPTSICKVASAGAGDDGTVVIRDTSGKIDASNIPTSILPPTGAIELYAGRSAPSGWLFCDGSAVSRTTYSALFAVISPSLGTVTVTLASPGVFTLNSHGLKAGDKIYLTTTGALPTGLSANTIYYVLPTGLTANDFQVSATYGGAAVNTSVSQSGTHTLWHCPFGIGDGSSTFNIPNFSRKFPLGVANAQSAVTVSSIDTSGDTLTLPAGTAFVTGQPVVYASSGSVAAGLANNTTYFIVASSGTTVVKLATTLANAQAGTTIDITSTGSGTHTLTLIPSALGEAGGEENHTLTTSEMPSHSHSLNLRTLSSTNGSGGQIAETGGSTVSTTSTGGGTAHNTMPPYLTINYIIKT